MHCSANRTAESTLKWVIRDASKNNLQWSAEAEARVGVRLDKNRGGCGSAEVTKFSCDRKRKASEGVEGRSRDNHR